MDEYYQMLWSANNPHGLDYLLDSTVRRIKKQIEKEGWKPDYITAHNGNNVIWGLLLSCKLGIPFADRVLVHASQIRIRMSGEKKFLHICALANDKDAIEGYKKLETMCNHFEEGRDRIYSILSTETANKSNMLWFPGSGIREDVDLRFPWENEGYKFGSR